MPATITKRRFNVHEYHRMAEAGVFLPDERTQLVDGEIVVMASIGSPHQSTVDRLTRLFSRASGDHVVRVQGPVRLDDWSEPEPDVSILRSREDFYASAHPTPDDVLLVVEVADTSRKFDREVKLPLYARAGIEECWIADLDARCVDVHRDPSPEGYGRSIRAERGMTVTPAALPDVVLRVDDILP